MLDLVLMFSPPQFLRRLCLNNDQGRVKRQFGGYLSS